MAKKDYVLKNAPETALALPTPAVNAAIFSGDDSALEGFKQVSLPPIIKPKEFPVGQVLVGKITGIMPSPIEEYKNNLLQLDIVSADPAVNGTKVCFPITSTIESALEKKPENFVGRTIAIKSLGVIPSRKDKKRRINNFQVFLKDDGKKK